MSILTHYVTGEGELWQQFHKNIVAIGHEEILAQIREYEEDHGVKIYAVRNSFDEIYDCILNRWRNTFVEQLQEVESNSIEATLTERGSRYGSFVGHARITQNIKDAMKDSPNWNTLSPSQKECLEMIAHKAGRILNGDPNYHDSWHDIVGYTKLVADELLGNIK